MGGKKEDKKIMWLMRDCTGELILSEKRPVKKGGHCIGLYKGKYIVILSEMESVLFPGFEGLKHSDEPVEVSVVRLGVSNV